MRVLAIYALQKLDAKEALPRMRALLGDHETIHFDGEIPVSDAARKAIDKLERKPCQEWQADHEQPCVQLGQVLI